MKNWQKNLLAIGLGILLVLSLELGLWIFQFKRAVCKFDPYLSFKESVPVLVEKEYTAEKWLALNPRLKAYFNPIAFPETKAPGGRRIFILGESSTLGFPFMDQGSYSWFLKLGLDQLEPTHRYQVINLGAFGFASYRILRVFKEVLNYEPDLMVVMTGQNEFLEKREYPRSARFRFWQEKLSRFKIYCLLKTAWLKLHPAKERKLLGADVNWEKMSADPQTRAKITEHFRFNADEMARLAQEQKVHLLFLAAPSNLKDFPPYHSAHRKGMSGAELESWRKQFEDAKKLMLEKKCAEAIPILEKLAEMDQEYAESRYLLGQCFFADRKFIEAKAALTGALEKDAWQVRALPEFNEILRSVSGEKAELVDLEEIFEDQSPEGIPGDNLFYDHCHPRIESQALIAREILKKLNSDQWLNLPLDWEAMYDDIAESYQASLSPAFWSQVYYNLAIELGVNMGLKELGRKYLQMGLEISAEDPRLKRAAEMLE